MEWNHLYNLFYVNYAAKEQLNNNKSYLNVISIREDQLIQFTTYLASVIKSQTSNIRVTYGSYSRIPRLCCPQARDSQSYIT